MLHGHQVESIVRASSRRLGLVLPLTLVVAVTACGAKYSSRSEGQAKTSHWKTVAPTSKSIVKHRSSQRLSADFWPLHRPAEDLPPSVRRILRVPVRGMHWNRARLLPVNLPGDYWLIPGDKDLCIVARAAEASSVGTVCATIQQALRHGIANTQINPRSRRRTIVGVAPDGTRTVVVHSAKSSTSVPVRNGKFELRDGTEEPPDEFVLR